MKNKENTFLSFSCDGRGEPHKWVDVDVFLKPAISGMTERRCVVCRRYAFFKCEEA
jgi:hypothetical protein